MTGFAPTEAIPRGGGQSSRNARTWQRRGKTKAWHQDEHRERRDDDAAKLDNRGVNHSGGGGSQFGLASRADAAAAREWAIDFGSAGGGGSACCDPSAGGRRRRSPLRQGLSVLRSLAALAQTTRPREPGFVITRTETHRGTRSHGLIGSGVAAHHRVRKNPQRRIDQQLRHS